MVALLVLYGGFVFSPYTLKKGKAEVRSETAHYVNFVTLMGLAFTALGLMLAIKEFRGRHERIVGYRDFYKWINELLREIQQREANQLFFYGSTLLPGNISYEDERQIDHLKASFEKIFGVSTDDKKQFTDVRQAVLITPTEDDLRANYNRFYRVRIKGLLRRYRDEAAWASFVEESFESARAFKEKLEGTDSPKRYIYTPRDPRLSAINQAYFISNGVRIIYAMPLHFTDTIEVEGEPERLIPHIVGFTTTAYEIVQAYHKHFDELSGYPQLRLLEEMYAKHLISPVNVRKLISWPIPENAVEALAEWDQDHFDNKAATETCMRQGAIGRNSHVLDVGSGIGGTARYLAAKTFCHVDGIELLSDRQEYAVELNREMPTDIQERVHFYLGDATQIDLPKERYTHVISFLSILHFVEKPTFLKWIGSVLQPGGRIFIDDYCRPDPDPSNAYGKNREKLRKTISCPNLLTKNEIQNFLKVGNIEVTDIIDMTNDWKELAQKRYGQYAQNQYEWEKKLGVDAVKGAIEFASGVKELFESNAIVGIRLVGEKPMNAS